MISASGKHIEKHRVWAIELQHRTEWQSSAEQRRISVNIPSVDCFESDLLVS